MSTNLSAAKIRLSFGNSTDRYETHLPSANSGNTAHSEATPKENLQCSNESIHSFFCPAVSRITNETLLEIGKVRQITAGEPCDSVPLKYDNCNCVDILRQFSNIQNATPEEISFIHLTFLIGLLEAENLAAKLHWRCQRPLQALHAMMSVPAQNCNVQSAKHTPLSGSPVSSRKRSSGG